LAALGRRRATGGGGSSGGLYDSDAVDLPQTKTSGNRAGIAVVVVGGLDPSGGAGLLRDAATALSRGANAVAVGTAWTEQGPGGPHQVEPRAPAAVGAALARALAAGAAAVKVGMAVGPATAAAVVDALAGYAGPVVVDPVLATSRGGALWTAEPRALLPLLRRASLVTPNAVEAGALAGMPVATQAEAETAGRVLIERSGLAAVVVKGGHLDESGPAVTDLLITPAAVIRLTRPRVAGPSPRGTGCALATAIAIELGRGHDLATAVAAAGDWLATAIAHATDVGSERHLR
jgi:hydroxymethylpyrimidine/phosphomethylpyrimidine kinase